MGKLYDDLDIDIESDDLLPKGESIKKPEKNGNNYHRNCFDSKNEDSLCRQENLKILAETEKIEKDPVRREFLVEARIALPEKLNREILQRANNCCENQNCKNPQSFVDKNGEIFLEIHHKIPYSECKNHTLENCIALCPNCHRMEHYG